MFFDLLSPRCPNFFDPLLLNSKFHGKPPSPKIWTSLLDAPLQDVRKKWPPKNMTVKMFEDFNQNLHDNCSLHLQKLIWSIRLQRFSEMILKNFKVPVHLCPYFWDLTYLGVHLREVKLLLGISSGSSRWLLFPFLYICHKMAKDGKKRTLCYCFH